MDEIIVGIDFSDASLHAAKYAADMAVAVGKNLKLVHVMEVPITPFQVPFTELEFAEIERTISTELEELQQTLVFQTTNRVKIDAELKYGPIGQELENLCMEKRPFALIMGIVNGGFNLRHVLGSNTLRMIHVAPCPVLIIPEKAEFTTISNVIIAADLSAKPDEKSLSTI